MIRRPTTTWLLTLALIASMACSAKDAPEPVEDSAAAAAPAPVEPAATSVGLPAEIIAALQPDYVFEGMETRYVSGSADLNGDGQDEIFVYLLGGAACGSGGCPTVIFSPSEGGYRQVAKISVSETPIRVSPRQTNGWANVIVDIGGGGGASGHAELAYGTDGYPGNPTTSAATRITDLEGTTIVIAEADFATASVLPAPGTP